MPVPVESDSNAVVEGQLNSTVEQLEDKLKADVLAYSGRIYYQAELFIRDALEWKKQQRPKRKNLAFFLETEGGYIDVAQRIANILRKHYRRVDFFVPDSAMSAGTVLVMSGDAIHMDYYSILGPIDPQIRKEGRFIPALGYLKKYEELMEKANAGGLNTAETAYLVTKFDPAELYQYEQARELSVSLLEEWLAKYKFRNWDKTRTRKIPVTRKMKRERAREIAEKLNDPDIWHSHGHGISLTVLRRKLDLIVEDYGKDRELSGLIRHYWGVLSDHKQKLRYNGVIHTKGRYKHFSYGD
jgi:hypothetical protein